MKKIRMDSPINFDFEEEVSPETKNSSIFYISDSLKLDEIRYRKKNAKKRFNKNNKRGGPYVPRKEINFPPDLTSPPLGSNSEKSFFEKVQIPYISLFESKEDLAIISDALKAHTYYIKAGLKSPFQNLEDAYLELQQKLLAEKPSAKGLTVPGMPMGSPGMEGHRQDHYSVLLIGKQNQSKVYNQY